MGGSGEAMNYRSQRGKEENEIIKAKGSGVEEHPVFQKLLKSTEYLVA